MNEQNVMSTYKGNMYNDEISQQKERNEQLYIIKFFATKLVASAV